MGGQNTREALVTETLVASNAHGARSKNYTRDDSAIEAQLRWLSTAAGQAYLSELSPAARAMYLGKIFSLLDLKGEFLTTKSFL